MADETRAFGSARSKGRDAFASGLTRDRNPYGDNRTDHGSVTWSRAFRRAWDYGWREAQASAQALAEAAPAVP